MNQIALWTGYGFLIGISVALGLLCVIGICKLFNRATWAIVSMYGGVKVLREFQHWYAHDRVEKSEAINHEK